ncbi:putative Serine hydroxymethyltransferase [Cyanobium sp. NIES-981]|nr:putative Serine hydroxymethyltransferase [Cyanobium sp. NIES-981]
MVFLEVLSDDTVAFYRRMARHIRIREDAPICRQKEIYGWYDFPKSELSISTERIISRPQPHHAIEETFWHELVHAAQDCKHNNGEGQPLGIAKSAMPLGPVQMESLRNSLRSSGRSGQPMEHEALWMETKPGKVRWVVEKYCL